MALPPRAVSAPGKVLLTGGYLVLDREYTGLVFALDARIHVNVEALPTSDGVTLQEVVVLSPQFRNAHWRYGFHSAKDGGGIEVVQLTSNSAGELARNIFIESALAYALTYITATAEHPTIDPSWITILADNDYYSHGNPNFDKASKSGAARFQMFDVDINKAHKTGLGSSAALVTAFIGSVLSHYLPTELFDIRTQMGKRRLHNLAQAAHSAAQGKVGSGFDVASAVFGSCQYRRFSPSLLRECGDIGSAGFSKSLKAVVDDTIPGKKWDTEVITSHVAMPRTLRLIMCDVDCGSKTPSMVKQLLSWRTTDPQNSTRIWNELQLRNTLLSDRLRTFRTGDESCYEKLQESIERIRMLLREMSELSKVPIEPESQTKLLDACTKLPGVLGGVTPGAGGYDAIALLIEDKKEVITNLTEFLASWKFEGPGNTTKTGTVRLLGAREEMDGVRLENVSDYMPTID